MACNGTQGQEASPAQMLRCGPAKEINAKGNIGCGSCHNFEGRFDVIVNVNVIRHNTHRCIRFPHYGASVYLVEV